MSNPFARSEADEAAAATPPEASVVPTDSPFADLVDPTAGDDTAPEVSADDDTEFGSFKPVDAAKAKVVPYTRLAKVIHERNTLRDDMSEAQQSLAVIEAKLAGLAPLQEVFTEKYQGNADLARFDATFMETFETLAKTDQAVAQAADRIRAAMGAPKMTAPVTTTVAAPAAPASEPSKQDLLVERLMAKEVKSAFTAALGEHLKPNFIEAVTKDVLTELSASELADASAEQIIEMAKVYLKSTNTPPSEYLIPKANGSAPKPSTKGSQGAPAAVAAQAAQEVAETPKFKTREEFDAARSKRFQAITKDLFGE